MGEDELMLAMQEAERERVVTHELENKSHDAEFSNFADGNNATTLQIVGENEVKEAYETFLKYREEKEALTKKLEENEQYWKMEHWKYMTKEDDERIKPKSAWLVNTILNKHADAMDNFPSANILPRAKDDEYVADILSDVVPVILEQNEFEETYSDVQWYKFKNGAGVYGIFWDNSKANGLGDIAVVKQDLANLYWKGGISDIQDSPNVFNVVMMPNKEIKETWSNINLESGGGLVTLDSVNIYVKDENINNEEMTPVIDWYYKKKVNETDVNGIPKVRTILHYCKFCNGQVIYASENDPNYSDVGWYGHGRYPFVVDVCFPIEKSVVGMGYIDIIKDDQMFIDKLQQAILENAVQNARPRSAVREDSGLNEEEYMDLSKPIIHFSGNLGEDAFRQITVNPLAPIYETVYLNKVQEMKDTSGNTASSQGQTSSVTSASGIASLQEAAGKLSRDSNMSAYRAFKSIVDMVIELIRQFYNEPRCFRITGDKGDNQYIMLDNSGLLPVQQGTDFNVELGARLPVMDIDVRPQKKSAYSTESQNQTALNLYNMGFFAPNNADASLACLEMMEFDGVEKIRERVSENQTLLKQVMALEQMVMELSTVVDADHQTQITAQLQAMGMGMEAQPTRMGSGSIEESRGSLSSQAAAATRGSASPR